MATKAAMIEAERQITFMVENLSNFVFVFAIMPPPLIREQRRLVYLYDRSRYRSSIAVWPMTPATRALRVKNSRHSSSGDRVSAEAVV
ncbi:hypothetical protein ACIRRA_43470 [Nocardia sp. NPDC101769]|uniref:hypothetical protein n=1 Tax=Nocardia sp. NPDC101769 TaxID=3364333 RepID=UPI00380B7287